MFSVSHHDDAILIHVRRDLDIATAKALAKAIEDAALASDGCVVVSLEDCAYCDASGLGTLLTAKANLGDRLVIVVPPGGSVRRIIAVTGLTGTLKPYESVDLAFLRIDAYR